MRTAFVGALAIVLATPVVADAPTDWVTRFAFLHAVKVKWLPPGPESWRAFACVARAAGAISDRNRTPPIRNSAEADEAIAPCKAEMDAIPAANMQKAAVDVIAKFRADRPHSRP